MKISYEKRIYIRNIYVVIILLTIIYILISPAIGGDNQYIDNKSINKSINYRVVIDQYHGFYRVYYANTSGKVVQVQYNGTLNINKGDTITWINDAVPDVKLTIMSQQKLWDEYAGTLKWAYKQSSYTFNKSGTYDVHIKEYSRFKQRIIVGPITNVIKSNATNTTKSTLALNSSITNLSKISSPKKNMTNISNKNSYKVNLSKTNITNVSKNIPEKNEIRPIMYLSILPITVIILMTYITKIRNKRS